MASSTRPTLTRWTAELVDREQERRFRFFVLPKERRAIGMVWLVLVVLDAVLFTVTVSGDSTTSSAFIVQAITIPLLAAVAAALWLRQVRWPIARQYAAVNILYAVAATLTASAADAIVASVLLVAGVLITYLAGKISLIGVAIDAWVFTVLMFGAWCLAADQVSGRGIVVLVTLTVLAHVLGVSEAHNAQGERRTLFAQQEVLGHRAVTDELTGLANRRGVQPALGHHWDTWRREGTPTAALMFDIDHFKVFNDTFGHPAGDVALRLVGDVFQKTISAHTGAIAARFGGEEFLCLIPGVGVQRGRELAETIRNAVSDLHIRVPGPDGHTSPALTVSGGVAVTHDAMDEPHELVAAADAALYVAKGEGRDCIRPAPA